MSAELASIKRQLTIKTGVVKRYALHCTRFEPLPSPSSSRELCSVSTVILISTFTVLDGCGTAMSRLAKEESSYLVEAKQQETRIAQFIDAGRDEYDVKQQVRWFTPLSITFTLRL